MSTRPTRPSLTPTAPTAPTRNTEAGQGDNTDFEALRGAHEALVRQRGRLELLHEQAMTEIQNCQNEAQRLGVSSIEELEALIERTREEDRQALESFAEAVRAEEELQKRVLADLAAIDS